MVTQCNHPNSKLNCWPVQGWHSASQVQFVCASDPGKTQSQRKAPAPNLMAFRRGDEAFPGELNMISTFCTNQNAKIYKFCRTFSGPGIPHNVDLKRTWAADFSQLFPVPTSRPCPGLALQTAYSPRSILWSCYPFTGQISSH